MLQGLPEIPDRQGGVRHKEYRIALHDPPMRPSGLHVGSSRIIIIVGPVGTTGVFIFARGQERMPIDLLQ
jgi:hypothetical protein